MIASNKQKQKNNNLAIIGEQTQGSSWALQEPLACPRTQMWTLTIMDNNGWQCELDETNTFIFS